MNTYFDNASTTWPKPPQVWQAMAECMQNLQGSPGRSGAGPLAKLLPTTREALGQFFNIAVPSRIIFTFNATYALNIAIQGYLKRGDRVVTSSMEHNAVCRPLNVMRRWRGVEYEIVRASAEGYVELEALENALKKPTSLVVLNHAANISGGLNTLEPIGRLCKEYGAKFMVDASQTAGHVDIDVARDHVDILACPGHKGLLGPTGTGICYLAPDLEVRPVLFGGTGNKSELDFMPDEGPERFEAGTPNFHGLAGLQASLAYIAERGLADIQRREAEITERTLNGILEIPSLRLHGPKTPRARLPVFSLTCPGRRPEQLSDLLAKEYGIATRVGLHCAPWAHETLGTGPDGTVRISPGLFHTDEEIDFLLQALAKAAKKLSGPSPVEAPGRGRSSCTECSVEEPRTS